MENQTTFGPLDERPWDRDVTLTWEQERWPTRRGWSVAVAVIPLIPALAFFPLGLLVFGASSVLGLWHVLRRDGPFITSAGRAMLRLTPDVLDYRVDSPSGIVREFSMDRAAAGELELRLMDKANTAISVSDRDGQTLELGERRIDPRIGGRHLLLSTWLSSWWPDATTWHERLGPRGLALLDATRSPESARAVALRNQTRRAARLAVASTLILLAWLLFLDPRAGRNGPTLGFPLMSGHFDPSILAGLVAVIAAALLILWPTIADRSDRHIPGPHGRFTMRPARTRTRPARDHASLPAEDGDEIAAS